MDAEPDEAVTELCKVTSDYEKDNGIASREDNRKPQPVKIGKSVAYEAAVKEAMNEPADGATTLKKKAAERLAAKAAPAVEEAPAAPEAEVVAAAEPEAPAVEEAPAVAEAPVEAVAEVVAEETPQA